ncbi:hypothetical protein BH11PSE11_BH11PSE11_22990 [soil metagenome]
MNSTKSLLAAVALTGVFASGSALAYSGHHHGHGGARVGVYIGAPLFWPAYSAPYYASPYAYYPYGYRYYDPPVVAVERTPSVYIEKGQEQASWYYCSNPSGYYPYVQQCPQGWQQVAPQAPKNQ